MFKKKNKEVEQFNYDVEAWKEVHKDLRKCMETLDTKLETLLVCDADDESDKCRITALMNACGILLDELEDVENRVKGHIRSYKIDSKRKQMED